MGHPTIEMPHFFYIVYEPLCYSQISHVYILNKGCYTDVYFNPKAVIP